MPDNKGTVSERMSKWALEHPEEWDVVLGFRRKSWEEIMEIQHMLKYDGFPELAEMMAIKVYRLLSDENNGEPNV